MERPTVGEKRRLLIYLLCCMLAFLVLIGRLAYIGLFRSSQWQEMAYEQQTRDRLITARRFWTETVSVLPKPKRLRQSALFRQR